MSRPLKMCARNIMLLLSFLLLSVTFANAFYDWYPYTQQYYSPPVPAAYQQGYPTYPQYSGYQFNSVYQYQQPGYQFYQPEYQQFYNSFQNAHAANPSTQKISSEQSPFDLSGFDVYWDYYKNITEKIRQDLNGHNALVKNATQAAIYPFYQFPSITDAEQKSSPSTANQNLAQLTAYPFYQYPSNFVPSLPNLDTNRQHDLAVPNHILDYTPVYEVFWSNLDHSQPEMKTTTQTATEVDLIEATTAVIPTERATEAAHGFFSLFGRSDKPRETTTTQAEEETTTTTTEMTTTTTVTTTTAQPETTTTEVTTTTEDENKIVPHEEDYEEYEEIAEVDDLEKEGEEETVTTTRRTSFFDW